ncbi:hypothetical protein VTK73DRAFT_4037 [Phialemonium thermophilum]|uniref:Alcohol dehydrogenase-like C-terminal domain-containing protein n=1 Tax=Phialemonium thermophilum TaxID=223376 RepID=A0ABR3VE88_9PEZI
MGAGTVGLLTAAMARQAGCSSVIIADVDHGRVDYAVQRGFATHGFVAPDPSSYVSGAASSVYASGSSGTSTPFGSGAATPASTLSFHSQLDSAKSLAAEILASARDPRAVVVPDDDEDDGVDITFECTGKEVCMHTSLYATRAGGKLIMVGMGTPIQTLPLSVAHLKEVDILGIFRYANTYATGIRLLSARGRAGAGFTLPSLDDMVTHRFQGLDAAKNAFELATRTVDDHGKLRSSPPSSGPSVFTLCSLFILLPFSPSGFPHCFFSSLCSLFVSPSPPLPIFYRLLASEAACTQTRETKGKRARFLD